MKKYKFITLAMVLAVMLMGAGYAYWTETLTISSTVTTGELDVQFVPLALLDGSSTGDYDNKRPFNKDYMDVSLTPADNNHKLICNFTDIYPGAGGYIKFRVENKGTVPAKLTSLVADNIVDPANLKDEFNYVVHSLRIYTPALGWLIGIPIDAPMYADTLQDLVAKLEAKLATYTLEPGGLIEINGEGSGYDVQLPSNVTNNDFESQTLKFDLMFTFTQGE